MSPLGSLSHTHFIQRDWEGVCVCVFFLISSSLRSGLAAVCTWSLLAWAGASQLSTVHPGMWAQAPLASGATAMELGEHPLDLFIRIFTSNT